MLRPQTSNRPFIVSEIGRNKPSHRGEGKGPRLSSTLLILFAFLLAGLPAMGQTMPAIGAIDYYGLHHVQKAQVKAALHISPGDKVPESPRAAEARIEAVPGVARARLNLVCCEANGKAILYVGILEKGDPEPHFRSMPGGKASLPAEILSAGQEYEAALRKAVLAGDAVEDDSQGYALNHNPGLRAVEARFITFATTDLSVLRGALRHSSDAGQRALATEIIGYAPDHRAVVPDLVYAMSDPNSDVRNNAMRALAIIAEYAEAHPSANIKVPSRPFIDLLNSLVWSDRNKAGFALAALTKSRNPEMMADLRRQALPALIEMAQWKNPGHAVFYCMILGRIAGLPETKIEDDFRRGEREKIIAAAMKVSASENRSR